MILCLWLAVHMQTSNHVSVVDFGASPNSTIDATDAVRKALAAAQGKDATVEFPQGEYHFYRENGNQRSLFLSNSDVVNPRSISILIENRKNLRLIGKGVRLVFHDRVMPFAILGCQNIHIDGFTVDWDRPLMSQALVTASDRSGVTLKIDPKQYPYVIEQGRLAFTDTNWKRRPWGMMQFDPDTKGVADNTGDYGVTDGNWSNAPATEISAGVVRLDYKSTRGPKVGHTLVFRHGSRDHAGTFILDSKNVTLTNIAYRHTSGLGVLSQYSENLTIRNVHVAPDPKSERMFAGHDDGLHFSNCRGKVLVENCVFEGLMDDPINVHGTSVPVVEKLSRYSLKCRFSHGQSVGLRFGDAGDTISFLDHESLLSRGLGKIASIERASPEEFVLTFKDEIPDSLKVGDALENLTWTPAFSVRGSTFGRVRARGLLVSTPRKVVVENNLFRSSGAAILIAGDANGWYESGAVTDVTIRKNRFLECNSSAYQFGDAVISIHPEIPKAGGAFHRNVRILDNSFTALDSPILWADSVSGLKFIGNKIQKSTRYRPWNANGRALSFLNCDNVEVADNHVDAGFISREIQIERGDPETIRVSGWPSSK